MLLALDGKDVLYQTSTFEQAKHTSEFALKLCQPLYLGHTPYRQHPNAPWQIGQGTLQFRDARQQWAHYSVPIVLEDSKIASQLYTLTTTPTLTYGGCGKRGVDTKRVMQEAIIYET